MTLARILKLACCLALLTLWDCWGSAAFAKDNAANGDTLELTIDSATANLDEIAVLPVALRTNGTQPSTIVTGILFDSNALEYVGVEAKAAAIQAGKVVQDGREGGSAKQEGESEGEGDTAGEVRFVVLGFPGAEQSESGPTQAMGDGTLFEVSLRIVAALDGDVLPIEIVGDTTAADAAASAIAVSVSGGQIAVGDTPDAPTGLSASGDRSDGVFLTWNAVQGQGMTYMLYRGRFNDPGAASRILASWTEGTSHLDTTANSPTPASTGCLGGGTPTIEKYYYWVRARNAGELISDYSNSVVGHRTGDGAKQHAQASVSPFARGALGNTLLLGLAMSVVGLRSGKRHLSLRGRLG